MALAAALAAASFGARRACRQFIETFRQPVRRPRRLYSQWGLPNGSGGNSHKKADPNAGLKNQLKSALKLHCTLPPPPPANSDTAEAEQQPDDEGGGLRGAGDFVH
jgi:hypothetical protein